MKRHVCLSAALFAACAPSASAEVAPAEIAPAEIAPVCSMPVGAPLRVELVSGDILIGTFAACDGDSLEFVHPRFGTLKLAWPDVGATAAADVPGAGVADVATPVVAAPLPAVVAAAAPGPEQFETAARAPKRALWKREMSAGLDGSMGNSENMSVRLGVEGERETLRGRADAPANYQRSEDDDVVSEHRVEGAGGYEWFVPDSPWELFGRGLVEYDEFKDYDIRVNTAVGPGYRFYDTDDLRLIAQVGAGVSREFGGIDDRVTPELLAAVVFERQLSEIQSIQSSLELFPYVRDPGEFRLVGRAEWELLMSQRYRLAIELGVEDRYDSNASPGVDANDLDYFAQLVKKF